MKLLSRCGQSTNITEQRHASASVISKLHNKMYPATTLQDRSVVYAARALVCDSKEEKEVMKLEGTIKKLAKRQPSKITGRHMYVKHLNAGHKRKRYTVGSHSSKLSRWNASKVIIRKHSASWRVMTDGQRSRYNDIASDYKDNVASEILYKMSSNIEDITTNKNAS